MPEQADAGPALAPEDAVLLEGLAESDDGLFPLFPEVDPDPEMPGNLPPDPIPAGVPMAPAPQVALTAPNMANLPAQVANPDALPNVAASLPAQSPSVAQSGLALPNSGGAGLPVPMDPPPAASMPAPVAPQEATQPDIAAPETTQPVMPPPAISTMPGQPVAGLPGVGVGTRTEPAPPVAQGTPTPPSALERNAAPRPEGQSGPLFALVLNDPGLPAAERLALASRALPFAVALNPMDPTAQEAAEIYRNLGKEVYLLAAGLPDRATPSDIDVTLSAFFGAVPRAAGLIDLPRDGFVRNARLMNDVMSVLAREGHGVITFAGGLGQAGRQALAVGVPHAEVYRVLDPSDESPFTIRRFLDRAVFQAVQTGQVVVFGEASNAAMLEALDLWQAEGRADQVALVPVSVILLGE
jgi:uncharacterized protein